VSLSGKLKPCKTRQLKFRENGIKQLTVAMRESRPMAKSTGKPFDREQEELLLRNHGRVGRGLIFLAQGLQPFVESQMQKFHGNDWEDVAEG
jgi:hypothetical protein